MSSSSDEEKSIVDKVIDSLMHDDKPDFFTDEEKKQIADSISNKKELMRNLDAQKHQVLKNIMDNRKKKSKIRQLYWYSAAASILVLVSLGLMFFQNVDNPIEGNAIGTITAGTDKATLTLSDGSQVALEKGQTYTTDQLESDGEQISYKSNKNAVSDIAYNYLTIPRGGQFHLNLSDGTEVWLNSETQIKYPVSFSEGQTRMVELVYGEAYFDVSPSTEHKGAKFKVLNKSQEIEVLGTEFNIKAYKDETNIYTTLVEGKVAVNTTHNKGILVPDQQAILNLSTNSFEINAIDVYNEISWKKGVFSFKDKTMEQIMTVLGRWYNAEFVFENEDLKNVQFMGVLKKDEAITSLLTTLKNSEFINAYEIKDNNTVILK